MNDNSIASTAAGYSVHDAHGNVVGWRECVLDANRLLHRIDAAETMRRVSDGAILAKKLRLDGEHFWSRLWRAA